MRIVLATPLYPPDVAFPAPYTKELAKRLSAINPSFEITVVTYSDIPEEIPGVKILAVSKHKPLITRLIGYGELLARALKNADIVYAENGSSVELPLAFVLLFNKAPLIVHLSDTFSHTRASQHLVYGIIERLALTRAKKVITDSPLSRPEILPFVPAPTTELEAYENSWKKHLEMLVQLFTYGN